MADSSCSVWRVRWCRRRTGCRQWRASRIVCEHGQRYIRISICWRSLSVLFCGPVRKLIECKYTGRQNTEDVGIKERCAGPKCVCNVLQSSVLLSSARPSVMPSSRCLLTASHPSSYSASPASCRNGEPDAGPGARGGSEVVRLIVGEIVEQDLELRPPTVMRPFRRRDIHFLFCFSNYSLIST